MQYQSVGVLLERYGYTGILAEFVNISQRATNFDEMSYIAALSFYAVFVAVANASAAVTKTHVRTYSTSSLIHCNEFAK